MSTTLLNYHDVNTIQLHVGLYKPKRVIKSKIVKKQKTSTIYTTTKFTIHPVVKVIIHRVLKLHAF
jgi:hypothetical protein